MSFDQETFHGQSNLPWDESETVKVPKFALTVGLISVVLGSTVSLFSFLVTVDIIRGLDVSKWLGALGYLLTLLVPATLIVYMRRYHMKSSKAHPDQYDAYSGEILARRLKNLAVFGLPFSLLAIYVFVLPFAEARA